MVLINLGLDITHWPLANDSKAATTTTFVQSTCLHDTYRDLDNGLIHVNI